MIRAIFLILILLYSCTSSKKLPSGKVFLKFNTASLICVYDDQLIIYLPEKETLRCLKDKVGKTEYEQLVLNRIDYLNDDTLRIIKPESNLDFNDDFQAGIFNCLADLLAEGNISLYNRETSQFESSIKMVNIDSKYHGKQRQYLLNSKIFLTQVIAFGE